MKLDTKIRAFGFMAFFDVQYPCNSILFNKITNILLTTYFVCKMCILSMNSWMFDMNLDINNLHIRPFISWLYFLTFESLYELYFCAWHKVGILHFSKINY